MSRVLVVEDEAHLAQGLRFNLQAEGYSAEVVGDGGLLVDATDPYALAATVARLTGEAGLRANLAAAAARRVDALDLASAGDRAVDLVAALSGHP